LHIIVGFPYIYESQRSVVIGVVGYLIITSLQIVHRTCQWKNFSAKKNCLQIIL